MTRNRFGLALLVTAAATFGAGAQDPPKASDAPPPAEPLSAAPEREPRRDPHRLGVPIARAELINRSRQAIDRGFEFLASTQNGDGTWGSHDPKIANLENFGFQLRNRGSQDGVRLACTGICATALMHDPARSEAREAMFQKAITALLGTEKFAYHHGEAFNTWGYGFKLDFLTRFLDTPAGAARREEIAAAAAVCIAGLKRFQQADGGWNYYGGPEMGGASMSFNTGNFVSALLRAKRLGLDVPAGMAEDPVKLLQRMRTAKGGFVYDARFLLSARSVNELSAGSRTVSCALALHDAGVFDDGDLQRSLEIFNEGENYLEDGRKLIMPHTAVHQISGYFFFYGYNYATEMAARLVTAAPAERWDRFAWTMVRTQEENGCWWDTPAADYGDKWATGFAIRTLQRYLDHCAVTGAP
jgi:hypothetical protein